MIRGDENESDEVFHDVAGLVASRYLVAVVRYGITSMTKGSDFIVFLTSCL